MLTILLAAHVPVVDAARLLYNALGRDLASTMPGSRGPTATVGWTDRVVGLGKGANQDGSAVSAADAQELA